MPTEPIQNLIPRKLDNGIKEILNQFSALIEEVVNFGSHAFGWCIESIKGGDQYIPVFQCYRHILELMDAISVLIRESCAEPCKIVLRAIFESLLSVEYILEKDTEQRGKDFLIWHRHHTLKIYKRYDPADASYKNFSETIKKDETLKNMDRLKFPGIEDQITTLIKLFEHPAFQESEKEYQRIEREKGKPPRYWFNMHGGPNNIYDLASKNDRPAQYEILYRQWSDLAHGTDIIRGKVSIIRPGEVAFSQLRLPTDAQFITFMTISFAIYLIRLFIDHFVKGKLADFQGWYISEIRDKYLSIAKQNRIEVV